MTWPLIAANRAVSFDAVKETRPPSHLPLLIGLVEGIDDDICLNLITGDGKESADEVGILFNGNFYGHGR